MNYKKIRGGGIRENSVSPIACLIYNGLRRLHRLKNQLLILFEKLICLLYFKKFGTQKNHSFSFPEQ